jgi:general secretion pathway protein G
MADSPPPFSPPPPPTSGLAIASLVLGIVGLTAGCLTGLPAVICGHMARSAIAQSNNSVQGAGLALAGLILGYLSLVVTALVVVLIFAGVFAFAKTDFAKLEKETVALAHVNTLKASLVSYRTNAGNYPTTAQGLKALVDRPTEEPIPQKWKKVLEEVPVDPWGNPFMYEYPGRKNPQGFDLFSPGPDGEPETSDDLWY